MQTLINVIRLKLHGLLNHLHPIKFFRFHISTAMALGKHYSARALFQKYCEWIAKNPGLSKEVELGAKLSSYLLVHALDSGGSSDSTHQMVYCLSDLFSFINDFSLSRAYPEIESPFGNNLKTWLTIVEHCEVCIELAAGRAWGQNGKWASIILIQVFKCLARLKLLEKNDGLLPFPPILPLKRDTYGDAFGFSANERPSSSTFKLGSGVVVRKVDAGSSFDQARPSEDFKSLLRDSRGYRFNGPALLGEVLYAVKPLIHLATMSYTGRNSWAQWATSLVLEGTSLRLQYPDFAGKLFTEAQELQYISRLVSIFMYLFRSPFYDRYVKSIILALLIGLRKLLPFLKFFLDPAIEFLPAWHETYFYLWSH